jgi:hypothetical protein
MKMKSLLSKESQLRFGPRSAAFDGTQDMRYYGVAPSIDVLEIGTQQQ